MRALVRARAALAEPLRASPWRALIGTDTDKAPAKPAPSAEQEAERAKVIADQFIPERHLEEHGALARLPTSLRAVVSFEAPDQVDMLATE